MRKLLFCLASALLLVSCSSTYVEVPYHGKRIDPFNLSGYEIPQSTDYSGDDEEQDSSKPIYYYQPETPPEPVVYQRELIPIIL